MNNKLQIVLVLGIVMLIIFPAYGKGSEVNVTLTWKSDKLMGWLYEAWGLATFDIDGDGVKDIIVPVNGNNVSIFSGATYKEIEKFQVSNNSFFSYLFNYAFVAQMDGDPDEELALGALGLLGGHIFVVDLKTHQVKMQFYTPSECMEVYDVDNDGENEIITASNHVEIFKMGSNSSIATSENISGYGVALTAVNIGGENVLFVAAVKSQYINFTTVEYSARIYEFSLPDLKMLLNISAGSRNLNTIAVGDINNDGKDEIVVGSGMETSEAGHITIYSLEGNLIWDSDALENAIENIKIVDLFGNGHNYFIVASQNIEIWNTTTKDIVWESDTLYDVGQDGGLVITKLSPNNTTKIITRAYDYSEGGRVYVYSVNPPTNNQNNNQSNNQTNNTLPQRPSGSQNNTLFIYVGILIASVAVVILTVWLLRRRRKNSQESKEIIEQESQKTEN